MTTDKNNEEFDIQTEENNGIKIVTEDSFITEKEFKDSKFKVIVVDSPEKWVDANCLTFEQSINFSPNTSTLFKFRGIPYSTWNYAMMNYKILDDIEQNKESNRIALLSRKIHLLEHATGKKFKGNSMDEKIANYEQKPIRFVDQLNSLINDIVCGVGDGPLSLAYKKELEKSPIIAKSFEDFDDLNSVNQNEFELYIQRQFQSHILIFPIKAVSQADKQNIESQIPRPTPPLKPRKDTAGRIDYSSSPEPDVSDPGYLMKLRVAAEKRITMYLDACLPFNIPGNAFSDKSEWIGRKLVGDVHKLHRFIEDNVINYTGGFSFF